MSLPDGAALRAVVVSPAMVRQRAATLLRSEAQVLVLRARPEWTHGDLTVDGQTVRVVEGISQLAILDAYDTLGPDDRLVVLTDRPREDLGESVLVRAYRQEIDHPDEWAAVPNLFAGAHEVSGELRRTTWAATALLDHEPGGGWPASPEPAVTAQHALGALLAHLLHLPPDTGLDQVDVLVTLGRREVRAAWAAVESGLRANLIGWALTGIGAGAAFALQVAQRQEHVTPLAVALAVDVLWPDDGSVPVEEQVAARVRVERYVDGRTVPVEQAKVVGRLAKTVALRLELDDAPELPVALRQAEALLGDVGWADGARHSTVLRPGMDARMTELGEALDAGAGFEDALARVRAHRAGEDLIAPLMAVRLARWLATEEQQTRTLAADLQRQMDDGAWVDAALGAVWDGSSDAVVGGAYRRLVEKVHGRRRARDEIAATRLAEVAPPEVAVSGVLGDLAVGVEGVLRGVIGPWKARRGALVVVLDGMSASIAVQLVPEVTRLGLGEWVPSSTTRRLAVAAALPSTTEVSRASLFSGSVVRGKAADEKKSLAGAFPGSVLFHKDELRAEGGLALARPVAEAIADSKVPVVGVVINRIDDAVHKNDTSGTDWEARHLPPLRALLEAAWRSGRAVVLTSDHGHVVERGSEAMRARSADTRWRPVGGLLATGEVLARGERVVGPEDGVVLLWRDDAHYGARSAGYHGGAALAEITVPVLVFQDVTAQAGAPGWTAAPVLTPVWWTSPVEAPPAATRAPGSKKRAKRPAADVSFSEAQGALFDVAETHVPTRSGPSDLVGQVLASAVYAEQRGLAGRSAADDKVTAAVLRTLLAHSGRAHRDAVAAAAGIAAGAVDQTLSVLKRQLNVDGYAVLYTEDAGATVHLDESLLREQFEVR